MALACTSPWDIRSNANQALNLPLTDDLGDLRQNLFTIYSKESYISISTHHAILEVPKSDLFLHNYAKRELGYKANIQTVSG